ncbi:MAG: RnfABCDGE type electron transport complex subunit D [Candidatus Omnitrophota bacterium]|nr:MAG: RnfABCDGE type electron transport complex subunit D [Candidatus Omnitrophota bacterium]
MNNKLIVSTSPHIYTRESSAKIMWMVTLSLVPAGIAGVYIFGLSSLWVILTGIISAVLTEAAIQKLRGAAVTLYDGSALLTGLLLAYCLPPAVPLWVVACGSVFAIAIGKQAFGGLGQNIFNPALAGRAFLLAAWPTYMTTWTNPRGALDAITSATPLDNAFVGVTYWDLFIGRRSGCIGEVCIIALLAGALFLLMSGYISWHIPFSFIATAGIFTWAFGADTLFSGQWLFHILSGGLILGAFFMATDYVTSPLTNKGKLIFGFGCGLFTGIIRLWGGYPEGVCYAILLMNAACPLIDRYTRPRRFGTK